MVFVLLLAAAAILGGVVVVAMGRGGELATFRRDAPEGRFRIRNAFDVAALRLPFSVLGYQEQATRDALRQIAWQLDERDEEIARLRDELWRLRAALPEVAVADADAADPTTADLVGTDLGDTGDQAALAHRPRAGQSWTMGEADIVDAEGGADEEGDAAEQPVASQAPPPR